MIVEYTPELLDTIFPMCEMMHQESRFKNWPLDKSKFDQLLKHPSCCCLLAVNQEPIGFFIGMVHEQWFGRSLIGTELVLYIRPEFRGGISAVRLIKRFEEFCASRGCVDINVGSSAEINTELAQKFYGRLGYKQCGFISHKER